MTEEKPNRWWWAGLSQDQLARWRAGQLAFEDEFGDFLSVFGSASGVAASPNGKLIGFQIERPDGSSIKFSLESRWVVSVFHVQIMRALEDANERASGPSLENVVELRAE